MSEESAYKVALAEQLLREFQEKTKGLPSSAKASTLEEMLEKPRDIIGCLQIGLEARLIEMITEVLDFCGEKESSSNYTELLYRVASEILLLHGSHRFESEEVYAIESMTGLLRRFFKRAVELQFDQLSQFEELAKEHIKATKQDDNYTTTHMGSFTIGSPA